MHKILRHPGHIVVDDVRHVVHMQAARRDVRGNTITAGLLTRLFAPTILAIRLFDAHSVVWKERGRNQMQRDRKEAIQCTIGEQDDRDPQGILDLIEQLDLDLIETEKNASKCE